MTAPNPAYLHQNLKNHRLRPELDIAIPLAIAGGVLAQRIQKNGYHIDTKNGDKQKMVTDADRQVNQLLLDTLQHHFPNDAIVSEELPTQETTSLHPRIWFLDPIDGTKEFIKGIDEWAVMIGLAKAGRPCLGVVYQPSLDCLYYAAAGGGAYCYQQGLLTQLTMTRCSKTEDAVLLQSRSHWSNAAKHFANTLHITKTRQQGSIGLKFGLIAQGLADLYVNTSGHCHAWDLCGPEAILEEAGGAVFLITGEKPVYQLQESHIKCSFLAAYAHDAKQWCGLLTPRTWY